MAVTKTIPVERITLVLEEKHINLIGESRWQEAKTKLPFLPTSVEKHFIGHLQTNKVSEVVAAFDCIETVDSVKVVNAINAAAEKIKKTIPVFIQVNISGDPNKHGFSPEQLEDIFKLIQTLRNVRVIGLMTITAKQSHQKTRVDFKKMKQLQLQLNLPELSMGMSEDWQIAIEEGATIVRLGTALFGQRLTNPHT